jgi:hypothetical protein
MSEGRDRETEGAAVASAAGEAGEGVVASPLRSMLAWASNNWQWFVPGAGGLLLLTHFWRIGFLPSLSFADLGAVLGAFVLFFVVGAMAFAFLVLVPVQVIATWVGASVYLPPPRKRKSKEGEVAEPAVPRKSLRAPASVDVGRPVSAAYRRVFGAALRPGALSSFVTASAVALLLYVGVVLAGDHWKWRWTLRGLGILLAVVSLLLVFLSMFADSIWLQRRLRKMRSPIVQWLLLLLLYLEAWPYVLILFVTVDGFTRTGPFFWLAAVVVPFAIPFVHWIWYVSLRIPLLKTMGLRSALIAGVMLYSGLPLLLVDATANTLGLGMMRHVDLVLTARGCDIVHAGWPERVCTPDHREGVEMGVLDDVEVLTRIGSQYYLAPPGGIDDPHLPRITVPASEVLGMVRK